jgi:hypothetical protein
MLPQAIFPPRPKSKLSWVHLPRYERSGEWVAQRKFNGKHIVVWVNPQAKEIGIWGRLQDSLARFKPTPAHKKELLSLALEPNKTYWFAGELMHQKTKDPHYQGRIILFDLLQAGDLFVNQPNQMGRLAMLDEICRKPRQLEDGPGQIALFVSEHVWMAETFYDNFSKRFNEKLALAEIEGLVLRHREGTLGSLCTRYWETDDLIRVRKPSKLYLL